ncbi:hypothetical protein PUNSTDRAFT_78197, partial [Punctularia strigosozonata HHB-11173 SS5]
MVNLFINKLLRPQSSGGLFGDTQAYYGTVEAQGRLTLHLHCLIWIKGSLSPQELRDRLKSEDQEFRDQMVAWLDSIYQGQFSTGTESEIGNKFKQIPHALDEQASYDDRSNGGILSVLPDVPACDMTDSQLDQWYHQLCIDSDKIAYLSNRHNPNHGYGCMTSSGRCRARFPRDVRQITEVDTSDGVIHVKHKEPWMNNYNNVLTYLMRCNTDVVSMQSGTQLRVIIAYITDYVTKMSLKTHAAFDAVKMVLNK